MIVADKSGVRAWCWAAYVRWAVDRAFRGIWVDGARPKVAGKLLFYANHPGWWDGFVFHQLTQQWQLDGYCMMDEVQLKRFSFLRHLGAFSIEKGHGHAALQSLRYAGRLLQQPKSAVIIFPEGKLSPNALTLQPLMRGVEILAKRSGAWCVPLGIRYAFLEHQKPDILVSWGEAHAPQPLQDMQLHLQERMDRLASVSSILGLRPLREMN